MFDFRLKHLAEEKGINNLYSKLREAGFSHHKAKKYGKTKIKTIAFGDLEKICKLFKCDPNTVIRWRPDNTEDYSTYKGLLSHLIHPNNLDLNDELEELTMDELADLKRFIKGMKEGKK